MKKNIFYLTALLFVFGCSNESDVSEPAEVAEPQTVLAEYMWCDFGPNTSPETLDALAADFREITENRYLYFDEYDPLSIANKIKFVLMNKSIQDKMISYGKKRINYFSLHVQKKNLNKFYSNL